MTCDKKPNLKTARFKRILSLVLATCIAFFAFTFIFAACDSSDLTNPLANAIIGDGSVKLHGIIGDANVHYTQDSYMQIYESANASATLYAWKGDYALSQIALISENAEIKNVSIAISDFSSGDNTISAANASVSFIDETLAYKGLPDGNGPKDTPSGTKNKALVPDVISGATTADIPRNATKSVWAQFYVPRDAIAGTYRANLTICGDGVNDLNFEYTLVVQDVEMPTESGFALELWQYPYSVAEYYGVQPFSDEHIEILKKQMALYADIGGDGITCSIVDDAWGGQTYSANKVRYPSMVKWTKLADGSFSYDYGDLDKWIQLNKSLGIGKKIVLYSIASWSGQIRYFDVAKNKTLTLVPTLGSAVWTTMWQNFLRDIISHLEDKGWFDETYMGVDERGFNLATLNLIDSVKGKNGKPLKTTGAFNEIENPEKVKLANRIDDISVGTKAIKASPQTFDKLLQQRKAMGKTTTIYTCTTHFPNNLALSMPGESYWIAFYCALKNADGYTRWAFDAWVKDPLYDTTHWDYEAGDCFQVYPGDASTGYAPRMSVRLAKLLEGIRDITKLKFIRSAMPSLAADVDALLKEVNTEYAFSTFKNAKYADAATLAQLPQDMARLKDSVRLLTQKYLSAI